MKTFHLLLTGTLIASLTLFTACKKDEETPEEETTKAHVNDQSASNEMDEVLSNVNDIINNSPKLGNGNAHRTAAYNLPCGVVSVDSSTSSGGYTIYKLNYGNQTACGYKKKSGKVQFTLVSENYFYEAGAEFRIKFIDYKVEVNATKQVVTLNGTIVVTNVNGGYVWEALDGTTTVVHEIRGYLDVTYADGKVRRRQYFQERTWDAPGGGWENISLTIAGDTSIENDMSVMVPGYSEVGKIYEGNYNYSTLISTPFKWENCYSGTATWAGPYVLTQGAATFEVEIPLIEATIDVEAGYYWDYTTSGSTPVYEGDCDGNAYKITTTIEGVAKTEYQLY